MADGRLTAPDVQTSPVRDAHSGACNRGDRDDRPRGGAYETLKESGVSGDPLFSAATVTTRFITPIPVSCVAWSTTLPDGVVAAVGSVQVELAAQRAVIPTTVT